MSSPEMEEFDQQQQRKAELADFIRNTSSDTWLKLTTNPNLTRWELGLLA
jgi:hypothetical protein